MSNATPLRAGLVQRAEDWPWSRLACRWAGGAVAQRRWHPGPVALTADWLPWVAKPQTATELEALCRSVARGRPYGSDAGVPPGPRDVGVAAGDELVPFYEGPGWRRC